MPLSLRRRYSQSYRRFKKPGYSRAYNMVFNYIRKKNSSYSPSNEQFIYSQAIKNNVRLCTQYYTDLVYKELKRYIMPSLQMRQMILRYFKSLRSGDYTYQQLNLVEAPVNYGVTLQLREVNYDSVAAAIASCITRELNNQNYGYALCPKYPYYYSDKNGVFLFPSAPIINCLYTQNEQQNIRMIFNKYFSQPPNFGAAYDCAVNQYPVNTNGVQYVSQGSLFVPQTSPAYPLQVASQYTYQLPRNFVDKMLYFVNSADEINMYVNRGPNNYLVNKYESKGKLPSGYYTPKQMMYLVRPFMYSYFQPDVPIYQSFTNYFTLHKGKWPDQDIRQVLTHFMAMDQFVDFDQNNQPIVQGVSSGKPLLGVRTQKEDDDYYNRQEYVSGDPIDGVFQPSDYIPVDGHFISDYQNAIQSGLDQYSIPQVDLNHKNDFRRVPDGADNF